MSAITFSPEKSAMKKREPKDPMVLRDQAKGRFRRDVHEALRGVPSLELKAKALVDTLDERWKDAGIERLYSRCPLLELQAKAGPVSRHATRSEGERGEEQRQNLAFLRRTVHIRCHGLCAGYARAMQHCTHQMMPQKTKMLLRSQAVQHWHDRRWHAVA